MKVVILAAGMGTRLQEVLNGEPKPLFKLNKKPLLEYSLEALVKTGIKDIEIVIGYKGDKIKEKITGKYKGMKINYVKNNIYYKTGSMHSLFSSLEEPEDCLVLEADIIYHPDILKKLINYKKKDAIVLSDNYCGGGDEVFVSLDKDSKVTYLGQDKPNSKNLFEFIGISKFSTQFIEKMFELHEQDLEKGNFNEFFENYAYRVSKFLPLYGLVFKNLVWAEIDKKQDIERAKETLQNLKL